MNYQETLRYIHQTPKFSRELGNRLLKKLLSCCGNPQNELSFVHIAGTNGKGSIAIMLAEILAAAGYRTGLFISPYLERFNERMQINGKPISDEDLSRIVTRLKNVVEKEDAPVSEFALDTAAAFLWFYEEKPDIVILETGLGGRLDATNVIEDHVACVITAIGKDHTQYLGETLTEITGEKCGILRKKRPVISYPCQEKESLLVIEEKAKEMDAPLYVADLPIRCEGGFALNGHGYPLTVQGDFQIYNAATAIKTVEVLQKNGFSVSRADIEKGLKKAFNPARYERFDGNIILDGAHNLHAMEALCAALEKEKKDIYFCIAMMEDKDIDDCVERLSAMAKGVVTTQIEMPRCLDAEKLAQKFIERGILAAAVPNPEEALKIVQEIKKAEDIACICGSLYLAGEMRSKLKK